MTTPDSRNLPAWWNQKITAAIERSLAPSRGTSNETARSACSLGWDGMCSKCFAIIRGFNTSIVPKTAYPIPTDRPSRRHVEGWR